jgi:hypothetical protein
MEDASDATPLAILFLIAHPVFITMAQCLVRKSPKAVSPGFSTIQTEFDTLDQVSVSMISLCGTYSQLA